MIKKHILNKPNINAGDIQRRHPRYLTCDTDKMYADLANEIYKMVHEDLSFMPESQIKNACISMALFFEDIHSGFHLFETFTQMYQKMFGYYLPFYDTTDANDPEAEVNAIRFMLWHSCVAERERMVLNPTNDGIKNTAIDLLDFWNEKKKEILPNYELADYLFAEETQTDANEVKTVLNWISQRYPLGRWFTNKEDTTEFSDLKKMLPNTDKDTLAYAADCYALCENRTWPLSVVPQSIYAEMIRNEMDDPNDELASAIEHIKFKPFAIYEVAGSDLFSVSLKDFLGDIIPIDSNDFLGDIKKLVKQNTHLAASFICLNNVWRLNGPCIWSKPKKKDIEKHLEKARLQHHYMNDFQGQYDEFINEHSGKRIYFFRNVKEYEHWINDELQTDYVEMPFSNEFQNQPMGIFLEDNGQMTTIFNVQCIKHPDNPAYNALIGKEEGIGIVGTRHMCSPGLLLYLMKHDMIPDVMFNDIRGNEHGRRLMQDNLEFIARCMRRDIPTDSIVRERINQVAETDNNAIAKRYGTKHPYDKFVELIAAEKIIRSKANKEWRVTKANSTTTIIRDVSKKRDHEIATRDLYEAHLALDSKQIQVAALVPFVGKDKAPAASALLYNIVGEGQSMNSLRKFVKELVDKEELDKILEKIVSSSN